VIFVGFFYSKIVSKYYWLLFLNFEVDNVWIEQKTMYIANRAKRERVFVYFFNKQFVSHLMVLEVNSSTTHSYQCSRRNSKKKKKIFFCCILSI